MITLVNLKPYATESEVALKNPKGNDRKHNQISFIILTFITDYKNKILKIVDKALILLYNSTRFGKPSIYACITSCQSIVEEFNWISA